MKNILQLLIFCAVSIGSMAQIAQKAQDVSPLLIGEVLPNATLVDSKNKQVEVKNIISQNPTVLVFYRGGWCPYCNVQLAALAEAEDEIKDLGYQIVGITPENYENLAPTIEKDKVGYQVYSDPEASFIQKVGIAFKMPESSAKRISEKSKGILTEVLPVPTVMLVDTQGNILFEYINVDYKTRISKDLLISAIKSSL